MRRGLVLLVVPLLVLALRPGFLAAQSRLFDGASLLGRIAPETPSAEYSFDASRGERIALRVLGLKGLDPVTTVRGPDGAELFTNFDDAWSPEPGDNLITFSAPDNGTYSVVIGGESDSAGDFLLQFNQLPAGSAALLPGGQAVPVPVSAAAGPLRLQFAANPDCPTVLVITPNGDPAFSARVQVYDQAGTLIAGFGEGPAEKRLTLEADSGQYVAEIIPLAGSADGQMVLTVACAAEQPACTEAPASTEAILPAVTPGGLLMVQPGGELVPGEALQGEIGQASPMVSYTFEGSAGEVVAVQVTGISLGFNPTVSLLGPTLAQVAFAGDNPGGFRASDALAPAVLPEDGRYTALVGSEGNLAGAFLIRLVEDAASAPVALSADAPAVVDAAALTGDDGWFVRYAFTALDGCPTALDVQTAEGFPFALGAVVRRAGGAMIGGVQPSTATGFNLVVPAGSGAYELLIPRFGDLDELGQLTLQVSCQASSPACTAGGSPLLISTPTPGAAPFATATLVGAGAGVTGVVSVSSANVRLGDGQEFAILRSLTRDTPVEVTGISNNGSGWYRVRLADGSEGWMSPQVLAVTGDTGALLPVQPPPRPFVPTSLPVPATAPAGSNAVCGNGWCEGDEAGSCCSDCGTCAAVCGNGSCESGETCSNCASDCGSANPDDACANYCLCKDGSSASVSDCAICESDVCLTGNMEFCSEPRAR